MTVGRRGSCPNPNIPLAGRQLKKNSCLFYYVRLIIGESEKLPDTH